MNPTSDLNVVLVRPLFSRNVGSVSRVMANMNAQRLILVDPKCQYDLEARQGAAGAQTHLLESTRHSNMDEFLKGEPDGIRIAFCANKRKEADHLALADRLKDVFADATFAARHPPFYLIFGPEDHGLATDDMSFAHHIVRLPTFGEFSSLNLSHAVLLALYVFRNFENHQVTPTPASATAADSFYFPQAAIKDWLAALGFSIGDRRTDAYLVLKRILLERRSTAKELRVLEAIIQQTLRKLKG